MLFADIENDLVRAQCSSGEKRAVEDEMGPGRHQQAILVALGLALRPIGDDHRPPFRCDRDGLPFDRYGEGCAAPSGEAAAAKRFDERTTRECRRSESPHVVGVGFGSGRKARSREQAQAAHGFDFLETPTRNSFRADASGSAGGCMSRMMIASATAKTQTIASTMNQAERTSVPVPKP